MLTLPPKFKQSLGNGTRTSLYPLVRIYKGVQIDDPLDSATEVINLSIKETNIGGEAYKGLLLNSPSISSKADIINNKYTISSVSLSISNAPYNGKIFSDDIPSLLNAVVQVYYAANGLDSLDDCLLVYTGTIRRYSQSAETLNLTLEDLTEQKLKTQIPSTLIDDFTVYSDEQIGKPYPMVYGYVDKSPLILDKFDSLIIDKPETEIGGIWENVSNIDFDNEFINDAHPLIASEGWLRKKSFLYTYKDGYCPIMEKMPYKFGSREHIIEDDMMYDFENQSVGNPAKINLNYLNFLYTFYVESDDELIGKGVQGIPTRIYRPVKKISFFAKNHERREEGFPPVNYSESVNKFYGFTANQNYDATLEPNHSGGTTPLAEEYYFNDWNEQNPNATFTWWKSTELNNTTGENTQIWDDKDINYRIQGKNSNFPTQWIQNSNDESGLHIFGQNRHLQESGAFARLEFDENIGTYPCITKLFYKIDYFVSTSDTGLFSNEPSAFWAETNLVNRTRNPNGVTIDNMTSDINNWEIDHGLEDWITYCEVPNHEHSFEPANTEQRRITNEGLGGTGFHNIILNAESTDTKSIQWGVPNLRGDENRYMSTCIANLKEFYTIQDVLISNYQKENYLGAIVGRIENDEVASKPYTILQNILKTELNYQKDIVLPDDNIQDDWINSFSMNEQSEAKNVIQNLFKSSIYIPSFDSDGNFKFIDLKQNIEDYEQFDVIDNLDIIKYSFGLTKLEDVKNQVNVKYKKDYGSDELTEETSYGIENNNQTVKENLDDVTKELTPNMLYDIAYYGMKNEDAKLEVESEYIRDKNTARKLQRRLLMWYANQHLTMKLDLPPSYIHLEAGDYLRFDELIGGKLAFGFDYTQEFVKNGQLIYPVFFVTKTSKSLSKVSLELVQVHRGDFGMSDDDLGNYEIPNPYDNKLYQPYVETDEDYFQSVWYNDNNLLESGPINAIVNTNFETDIEFNIKLIYSSQRFNYGDIEIFEGDNDINAISLVYARKSVTESSFGNNIEINPIIDIDNIYGAADNYELKFELEIVSNVDSSYTTILEFSHRFEKETALLGDMNNDGNLNVLDVILIAQETFNPEPNPIADINQDGVVNVVDVLIILNQVLGD